MKKEINLSVVIPCFNEQKNIYNTLQKVINILKDYQKFEILVVDDGGKDKTKSIVTRLIKTIKIKNDFFKKIRVFKMLSILELKTHNTNVTHSRWW